MFGDMSWLVVFVAKKHLTLQVGTCLCSASVNARFPLTVKHMICILQMLSKTSFRIGSGKISAFEPMAWDHKKRCRTRCSPDRYPMRVSEVTFDELVPSIGFLMEANLRTRLSSTCCCVGVSKTSNASCKYRILLMYKQCRTSKANSPW